MAKIDINMWWSRLHFYFVKERTLYPKSRIQWNIVSLLEFLVDNIFVEFGWHVFQSIVGISMGTNPLLADLFCSGMRLSPSRNLSRKGKKGLTIQFHFHEYWWSAVHYQSRIYQLLTHHLSHWAWDYGHYKHLYFYLILGYFANLTQIQTLSINEIP